MLNDQYADTASGLGDYEQCTTSFFDDAMFTHQDEFYTGELRLADATTSPSTPADASARLYSVSAGTEAVSNGTNTTACAETVMPLKRKRSSNVHDKTISMMTDDPDIAGGSSPPLTGSQALGMPSDSTDYTTSPLERVKQRFHSPATSHDEQLVVHDRPLPTRGSITPRSANTATPEAANLAQQRMPTQIVGGSFHFYTSRPCPLGCACGPPNDYTLVEIKAAIKDVVAASTASTARGTYRASWRAVDVDARKVIEQDRRHTWILLDSQSDDPAVQEANDRLKLWMETVRSGASKLLGPAVNMSHDTARGIGLREARSIVDREEVEGGSERMSKRRLKGSEVTASTPIPEATMRLMDSWNEDETNAGKGTMDESRTQRWSTRWMDPLLDRVLKRADMRRAIEALELGE